MKIFFSASDGLSASATRSFEGGQYNHTGFILPDGRVIEVTGEYGVHFKPSIDSVVSRSTKLKIYEISLPNEKLAVEFLFNQIGKPYDRTAIWGFILRRDWQEDDSWTCAELLGMFLLIGGRAIAGSEFNNRIGVRLTEAVVHALSNTPPVVLK